MPASYPLSEAFHEKYRRLYDRRVKVFMRDGGAVEGVFCDEFFEDESVLVSGRKIMIIRITDVERMEAAKND